MVKHSALAFVFAFHLFGLFAQDIEYISGFAKQLSSPEMHGRAYVKKGDLRAAKFIINELRSSGVEPLQKNYRQPFSFPMNTFPGKMEVSLDSKKLKPVSEFVVSPNCKSIEGTFDVVYLPAEADTSDLIFDNISKMDYSNKFVVTPFSKRKINATNTINAAGFIIPKTSLIWWASNGHSVAELPIIHILNSLLLKKPTTLTINIKNKFIKKYSTQNIVGFIPGSELPDSFIVFTAHYDHLGLMGKGNIFPGANDNASGTALVMGLAKYFSKAENKPKYSVAFIFFAAEEAGLLGSSYYTENPVFPLKHIKALINLDMVGSGSEGIAIVNSKANPQITNQITKINDANNYFSNIKLRGESCNSDHCFFHKKGVPAIFIYTQGPECIEYHNLNDVIDNVPFTKTLELQKLLIEFVK
ncbi:MAG: M28 family peptidase [Salinivirgaceae bacterium]|nr:M28 family peptidase [Salinivirgaceae bacterium]